jgi:hypothetical protein
VIRVVHDDDRRPALGGEGRDGDDVVRVVVEDDQVEAGAREPRQTPRPLQQRQPRREGGHAAAPAHRLGEELRRGHGLLVRQD